MRAAVGDNKLRAHERRVLTGVRFANQGGGPLNMMRAGIGDTCNGKRHEERRHGHSRDGAGGSICQLIQRVTGVTFDMHNVYRRAALSKRDHGARNRHTRWIRGTSPPATGIVRRRNPVVPNTARRGDVLLARPSCGSTKN